LAGVYKETTNEELSKVLGTYSNSTYYGPKLFEIGYGTTYSGLEELFIGMKEGGKATAIIPPWLTTKYYSNNWTETNNFICEVEVVDVIKDMVEYQADTMKRYAQTHYPGLDTTSSGFYFKELKDVSKDTLKSGSVSVYYVGKLLNGFVFDTNIADTAKKYKIYNSSSSYTPLSVTIDEDLKTMTNNNNLVEGFCKAIQKMSYGDEAFTMFSSDYGYAANGNGQIGPYQPLIFWLYIEPND
jgi:FKBP-type peptidyl-prolyl cis-trans isomerases 1